MPEYGYLNWTLLMLKVPFTVSSPEYTANMSKEQHAIDYKVGGFIQGQFSVTNLQDQ